MQIVKQSWEFLNEPNGEQILQLIEIAGRTCYKSEDKITPESSRAFVKKLIDSGHHAMIEHGSISVKMVTDRGVTHEIVRHRIASYAQESTRYCNYSKDKFGNELMMILPVWFYDDFPTDEYLNNGHYNFFLRGSWSTGSRENQFVKWYNSILCSEMYYLSLTNIEGQSAQEARSVLPNSLKTEIVMTANPREWRHFFTLRASKAAHPQMRALALDMFKGFKAAIPVLFDDIYPEVTNE